MFVNIYLSKTEIYFLPFDCTLTNEHILTSLIKKITNNLTNEDCGILIQNRKRKVRNRDGCDDVTNDNKKYIKLACHVIIISLT